jgi:D-amino-acid dehydrogenase
MHIIVVGAGILGASTAFHLARAGAQVTIIDYRRRA